MENTRAWAEEAVKRLKAAEASGGEAAVKATNPREVTNDVGGAEADVGQAVPDF